MDRQIPVASKLCFQQQIERCFMIHQQKMAKYKTMIDNKPPPQVQFLRRRCENVIKKAKVERQNRILVNKIETILNKGHHLSIKKSIERASPSLPTTMNTPFKKRQDEHILRQNLSMLRRLHNQTSPYSCKRYLQQRSKIQKNIQLMSTVRTEKKMRTRKTRTGTSGRNSRFHKDISNSVKSNDDVKILYHQCQQISGKYYYVQIHTKDGNFCVAIENVDNQTDRYQLKIPEEQGQKLLKQTFQDYEHLVAGIVVNSETRECYIQSEKKTKPLQSQQHPPVEKPQQSQPKIQRVQLFKEPLVATEP